METDQTYPIDLITTYLTGEAGSDDIIFLENWIRTDPLHRKFFEDYTRTWVLIEKVKIEDTLNIDVAWKEMESIINRNETTDNQQTTKKSLLRPFIIKKQSFLRIAAIFLILVIPSFFILRNLFRPEPKQMEASLSIKEGRLPDGTSVTLNKGTILEYPSSFKGNNRDVKLNGEAYFEVKHDEKQPFIVSSHNVRIEVLGTSFYVNTNATHNTMEVILNSGSVAIYFDDQKEHTLILSPGEKAEINPCEQKMDKEVNTDPNYRSWMTQRFIYNNEPLFLIVADLNKVYHSNLRISTPGISNCLITAAFDHQSVESILNVLQATLDLTISNHGKWIEISGKKCN